MIGAREISEYAQKYNMELGKDTPLSMEWCFKMADKAYDLGRADVLGEVATRLEEELIMVMPRDNVKFLMYKVHTVLEQIKESKNG